MFVRTTDDAFRFVLPYIRCGNWWRANPNFKFCRWCCVLESGSFINLGEVSFSSRPMLFSLIARSALRIKSLQTVMKLIVWWFLHMQKSSTFPLCINGYSLWHRRIDTSRKTKKCKSKSYIFILKNIIFIFSILCEGYLTMLIRIWFILRNTLIFLPFHLNYHNWFSYHHTCRYFNRLISHRKTYVNINQQFYWNYIVIVN